MKQFYCPYKKTVLFFVIFLVSPCSMANSNSPPVSDALQSLMVQANDFYFGRLGSSGKTVIDSNPGVYATILGLTLYRQKQYSLNQKEINQFVVLQGECMDFISFVARHFNDRDPASGNLGLQALMEGSFRKAINGEMNRFFIERYRINPATINAPKILAQVRLPGYFSEPENPRLPIRQDKPDTINIGGIEAGASETTSNYQYPKAEEHPPADAIAGTWHECNNTGKSVTFSRHGNSYVFSEVYRLKKYNKPYTETVTYTVHSSKATVGAQSSKNRKYFLTERHVCRPMQNTYSCRNGSVQEKDFTVTNHSEGGYYIFGGPWSCYSKPNRL